MGAESYLKIAFGVMAVMVPDAVGHIDRPHKTDASNLRRSETPK
jgi:hypothetical protein